MYVHLKKHRLRETGLGRTAGPVFVLNGGNMKTEIRGIRLARLLLFWFAGNLTAFFAMVHFAVGWKILIGILTGIAFLFFQFFHPHTVAGEKKLASLEHGCNLLRTGAVWLVLECVTVGILIWSHALFWALELVNLGVFALLCWAIVFQGLLHIALHSSQVKLPWHIALFFLWWMPVLNLFLIVHIYRTAKHELHLECAKAECDIVRKESEICKTRYPILLVHGIFFRDWQLFNYWGRIPAELQKNGAVIFYGKQQSAQSISESARELAAQIKAICTETGAEKVNIIAHSKGGLDCRCALQDYGVSQYVASLTTINTPHHGCAFVDDLLRKVPDKTARWIADRYNKLFLKLGDDHPDFLAGVRELTDESCRKFHAAHPCLPNVYYQCVMSKMHSAFSAPFPLWLGYLLNKRCVGENDGLVPVSSAKMENVPLLMVPDAKRRGISHGDMIDLNRENIPGFDVREWYVQLVQQLKQKGF